MDGNFVMINIGYALMIQPIVYYDILISTIIKPIGAHVRNETFQNGVSKHGLRVSTALLYQRPEPLEKLGYETEFSQSNLPSWVEEQRLPADNACGCG